MQQFAALFPGQGSQFVGMAKNIVNEPLAAELFSIANEALDFDIKKMCLDADAETLKLTKNAQPCIYLVSYIAYRLFADKKRDRPVYVAGHSLGEYTALAVAEVFEFTDGLKAVRNRGMFMQEAVPVGKGAMAAILGADPEKLLQSCNELSDESGVVSPANFNCAGQIVVSGHVDKVNQLLGVFRGKRLDVSAPFHSQLMVPAAEKLHVFFRKIKINDAIFPVISNTDNVFRESANTFVPSLIDQITKPVRWDTGIKKILELNVNRFIEFGPGNVLSGLMKRIDRGAKISSVLDVESINHLIDIN